MAEKGTWNEASGYERDAGEQVEGSKAESADTGGGGWREWMFV